MLNDKFHPYFPIKLCQCLYMMGIYIKKEKEKKVVLIVGLCEKDFTPIITYDLN